MDTGKSPYRARPLSPNLRKSDCSFDPIDLDEHQPCHRLPEPSRAHQSWAVNGSGRWKPDTRLDEDDEESNIKKPSSITNIHPKNDSENGAVATNTSRDTVEDEDPEEPPSCTARWSKKRFMVPLAVLITLIAVGSVLGGVLGTIISTSGVSSSDKSPTSIHGTVMDEKPSIHPSSQLAAGILGTSSAHTRVILFQNLGGDLMALEWQGSSRSIQPVKELYADDNQPPKPYDGSPLQLVNFGPDGDLHLFYIDEDLNFAHLVRRTAPEKHRLWELGSLLDPDNRSLLSPRPAKNLRFSVTMIPAGLVDADDGFLVIMYQPDPDDEDVDAENDMITLSSSDPKSSPSWKRQDLSLDATKLKLDMNPDSPGFLILPSTMEAKNGEIYPGIRILWELKADDRKSSIGGIECEFSDNGDLTNCEALEDSWIGIAHPVRSTHEHRAEKQ